VRQESEVVPDKRRRSFIEVAGRQSLLLVESGPEASSPALSQHEHGRVPVVILVDW
jgi:hypothetical protein